MSEVVVAASCPARGRRYSAAQRKAILEYAATHGDAAAVVGYGCWLWSVRSWREKAKKEAMRRLQAGGSAEGGATAPPPVDERERPVLETWRKQPGLGPSQIRNLLRRKGLKASVGTARTIMEEHGYVQPKLRRKEHPGRYEAVRPLQLVHMDFVHFHVHAQRQALLFVVDDYSRFITGFELLSSEKSDGAIRAFEESISRYLRPEAVMTDRGEDRWVWGSALTAPASVTHTLTVHNVAPSLEAARLLVAVRGYTDDRLVSPDHHLRLWWNGQQVHDSHFDGRGAHRLAAALPSGLVVEATTRSSWRAWATPAPWSTPFCSIGSSSSIPPAMPRLATGSTSRHRRLRGSPSCSRDSRRAT